ncbi:MAG: hypothetical protein ACK4PI_06575 [Tepidisphaerales bacterium]
MVAVWKRLAVVAAVCAAVPASASVILTFDAGTFTGGANNDGDVLTQGFRLSDRNTGGAAADAMVDVINGDGRVRSREFAGGILTLTEITGETFDLESFVLTNWTFNVAHRHGMRVRYNYFDGSSEVSPDWLSGIDFPANRNEDGTTFVVNKVGLLSVEFINIQGLDPTTIRLVTIDDIKVTVNPIPEPAAMGLLVPAAAMLLRRRGR